MGNYFKRNSILFFCISVCAVRSVEAQKNFVLLAAPGAGKGTFSQYAVDTYGYVQICPGDLYRNEIRLQTELGKKIQPQVEKGEYVDEAITWQLITSYLTRAVSDNKPFIIDGFPRTVASFFFLKELLVQLNVAQSTCYLELVSPDEVCIARVVQRQVCPGCFYVYNALYAPSADGKHCDHCSAELVLRPADTRDSLVKRLDFFHKKIEPLMLLAADNYETKRITTDMPLHSLTKVYYDLFN